MPLMLSANSSSKIECSAFDNYLPNYMITTMKKCVIITALCKNNGTRVVWVHFKKLHENLKNIMSYLQSELCSSQNCNEDCRICARPHGAADSKQLHWCIKFASL